MEAGRFERLKARVARELTPEQCLELGEAVQAAAASRLADVALARRSAAVSSRRGCPHCGHGDIVKYGRDAQGRQRFRCRRDGPAGCGRTFNALTGTAFARMRKPEKWAAYARMVAAGFKSVDDVKASGLGIARLTAWRWRHRLLRAQAMRQAAQVGGVIEADETYFLSSYKGHRGWQNGNPPENRPPRYRGGPAVKQGLSSEQIPVLTALDNAGGIIEEVLPNRAAIAATLQGRIAPGSVLCSDGHKAYVSAAVKSGSEHRRIMAPKKTWLTKAMGGKPRRPGRLGLGHVNAHHERTKTFVNRQVRGVSTRHLPLYLGWLRALRRPGFSPEALIDEALSTLK